MAADKLLPTLKAPSDKGKMTGFLRFVSKREKKIIKEALGHFFRRKRFPSISEGKEEDGRGFYFAQLQGRGKENGVGSDRRTIWQRRLRRGRNEKVCNYFYVRRDLGKGRSAALPSFLYAFAAERRRELLSPFSTRASRSTIFKLFGQVILLTKQRFGSLE